MTKPKQADGEIHGDQLLNFLVNALAGAFSLDIGENADLDAEDLPPSTRRSSRRHVRLGKYYSRRFGIEPTYRLSERSVAHTTTQNPAVRFLYVLISFLLQNAWRYLHWEYVASPRRGARRFWP